MESNMLHGAKLTISLTTFTCKFLVLFSLGVFLALGKISKNRVINKIASAYVFFFRGTPLLIQLFVVLFYSAGTFWFLHGEISSLRQMLIWVWA
ncbi:MAG: ABC transporter permease subunit [Eubacterium sp.]